MKRLTAIFRHHPVLSTAFVLAAVVTVLFIARTVMFTIHWADYSHREVHVEPWMTPGYVAHAWHLPPEDVARLLNITPKPGERRRLEQIAHETGLTLDEIEARLRAAVAEHNGAGQ